MPPLNLLSKTSIAIAIGHLVSSPAGAATLTVNSLADNLTAGAGCTLREAVVSVNTGVFNDDCGEDLPGVNDEIVFDAAYGNTDTISLSLGPLEVRKSLVINAPESLNDDFLTILQTSSSERVFDLYKSSPSVDLVVSIADVRVSGGDSVYGAGFLVDQGAELSLENSQVTGNDSGGNAGGGLAVTNGSKLVLRDSTVDGNYAVTDGGGLLLSTGSTALLYDSDLTGNTADTGGAIAVQSNSSLTISNGMVYSNYALTYGAGIATDGSVVQLDGVYIGLNTAYGSGGAMHVVDSSLSAEMVGFATNEAERGGGINVVGTGTASVSIRDSLVYANYANSYDGGGVQISAGTVVLERTEISLNSAGGEGGGAFVSTGIGSLTINNSTVSTNYSTTGGGGVSVLNGGTLMMGNASVVNNYTGGSGGGVLVTASYGLATLANTAVVYNEALASGQELAAIGGSFNFGGVNLFGHYSIFDVDAFFNTSPGVADITATYDGSEPTPFSSIMGDLEDNGGPTSSHAVIVGSPLDNVADSGLCPDRDQRGQPRDITFFVPIVTPDKKVAVIDLGGDCDIGAFEL